MIPSHLSYDFYYLCNDLTFSNDMRFKRHVIFENPKSISLHAFSDAFFKSYGACFYISSVAQDDQITRYLFCSEDKVSPIKVISIPRLELLAGFTLAAGFFCNLTI